MDRTEGTLFRSRSAAEGGGGPVRPGERPLILATNDDGYDAPGLHALVEAMATIGRVVVAAPDREQSGTAHALTLDAPLRVYDLGGGHHRITGTPTDCVHLAVTRLTGGRLPNLVVSGINRGLNVGDDVTYSGTVAGALEGTLLEIPSIAVSMQVDEKGRADYPSAGPLVRMLASAVLERGLPKGVLLNLNLPREPYRGVRVTRQGTQTYRATALERTDPSGRPYFWIADAEMTPTGEPDGDHAAIAAGYASVSPLHANMTHEPFLGELGGWLSGEA